ncbi:SRPBCC family protein [Chamaesiphon minutus]|uniref:Putative integral membrane protein n=1 Tax=Chamaesiphon minutus (strain ATCC 27169 / PCC 6605) TaxID=1173020 RepID=K9UEG5_CHAP6|nr:SRPBCC family protein [Chamaesiphon minutus]AFY93512.1 putative integral membrane protein [Chamaesiphon minutus PCC 6605]
MEIQKSSDKSTPPISDTERWGTLITGGAMVLAGLSQRSLRGALMAVAGGTLAYHGATSDKSLQEKVTEATGIDKGLRVEKTVTIQNKSIEELYQYWHNFENLPTFMKHLKSVTVLNETRSHWIANAPLGNSVEWDADIITDTPNRLISWASIPGANVENSGFVRFTPAPPGRGVEVKVVLEYSVPGGALTAAIASVFGENPEQQIGDDLRRFKMLMETGELAISEGQSSGREK